MMTKVISDIVKIYEVINVLSFIIQSIPEFTDAECIKYLLNSYFQNNLFNEIILSI